MRIMPKRKKTKMFKKFSQDAIDQISKDHNISQDFAKTLTDVVSKLRDNGIDYRIVGGLAVGVHSPPRSTQDVDFYVDEKDIAKLQTLFPDNSTLDMDGKWDGLSVNVNGIDIDFLYTENQNKQLMKDPGKINNDLNFLSLLELIYTKIISGRLKDANDVATLVQYFKGDTETLKKEVLAKIKKYPNKYEREEFIENLEGAFLIGEMQRNKKSAFKEMSSLLKKFSLKYNF